MIINDRDQSRRVFFEVWQKHRQSLPLEPMESVILSVIRLHPEYHEVLEDEEEYREADFSSADGGHNPFLHMGLHIAVMEQVATDRPSGMASLYRTLLGKCNDEHVLLHRVMDCLEESLWQAQQENRAPDDKAYLDRVRSIRI